MNNPDLFLFNNQTTPVGTTVSFPATPGDQLIFELRNLTVPNSFATGATSTNVAYLLTSDPAVVESSLGVDLSPLAEAALGALALNGPVVVLAFDDRALAASDQDFNDLIFAFSPGTGLTSIPGPPTLGLFALGLLGLGARRTANINPLRRGRPTRGHRPRVT